MPASLIPGGTECSCSCCGSCPISPSFPSRTFPSSVGKSNKKKKRMGGQEQRNGMGDAAAAALLSALGKVNVAVPAPKTCLCTRQATKGKEIWSESQQFVSVQE